MGFLDRLFGKAPPADTWKIAQAEDKGKLLIFRIREVPPAFARKEQFPLLLAVCWKVESPDDHGMPSEAEADRMAELEDLLAPALEGKQQAFLTVIVTGNGVRQWQWYARDQDAVMKLVNRVLGPREPFPVEFAVEDASGKLTLVSRERAKPPERNLGNNRSRNRNGELRRA